MRVFLCFCSVSYYIEQTNSDIMQIQLIKNNQSSYTINTHTHSYYAHCQYSRKFNYRRILHIHTPHNRDLPQQDDKLETNKRIGTDSSHSENERETQQSGDLLFVCENGKATHNGQYSLLSLTRTGIVLMRESEELTIQLLFRRC